MPRILPVPNMETHEYVTVRITGTIGPGQDNFQRVLRKKVQPVTP